MFKDEATEISARKACEKIITELDIALEDELKKLVLEQNEDLLTVSHSAN